MGLSRFFAILGASAFALNLALPGPALAGSESQAKRARREERSAALGCISPMLDSIWDRVRKPLEPKDFDYSRYAEAKDRYARRFESGRKIRAPKSLSAEERLALVDAAAERLGLDFSGAAEAATVGPAKIRRRIRARLDRLIGKEGGISPKALQDFLADIYEIQHPDALKSLVVNLPGPMAREAIEKHVAQALRHDSLEGLLRQAGLFEGETASKTRKALARFRDWRERHQNLEETFWSAAIGGATWMTTGAPYTRAPGLSWLRNKEVPREILDAIRSHIRSGKSEAEALEAVRPMVEKAFGRAAKFDQYWKRATKLANLGLLTFAGAALASRVFSDDGEAPGEMRFPAKPLKPQAKEDFLDGLMEAQIEAYRDLEDIDGGGSGRWPDPDSEEVRKELQHLSDSINASESAFQVTPEELRDQFVKTLNRMKAASF